MIHWLKLKSKYVLAVGILSWGAQVFADSTEPLQVAVAANMTAPMQALAPVFEKQTGHQLALSYGSTGKFYAQIVHGAPFDVFLAADQATPTRLAQENLADASTQWTYALGTLVLWSADAQRITDGGSILEDPKQFRLAVADPKLAPYGKAAQQTLNTMDLWDRWHGHMVVGENIGQTYQFTASGNAQLGFVALSQVWENGQLRQGSVWEVPRDWYSPIAQDGIVLNKGKDNPIAQSLIEFMQSPKAAEILESFGYQMVQQP